MTAGAAAPAVVRGAAPRPARARLRLGRQRGLLIACGVFVLLLLIVANLGSAALTYYDLSQMATTGATLAIAATGQTLVVLSGGFDLSAGAVVSLVNVVLATAFPDAATSPLLLTAVGVGIGMASGAFNAVFIALLRLQPIVVTLSTMFILQGVTLLVMEKPGGTVPATLSNLYLGDAIPNLLPRPIVLLAILFVLWAWLRRTRLGTAIYAVGSDADAARAAGIATRRALFAVYVMAGGCYGLAGTFISAQTGSGDPLVGNPLLLQVFAAIVVGGTRLGGGRGGVFGSMIGAYILMLIVNILLVLNISAYYSTVAEGSILILAVLGAAIGRDTALAHALRYARARLAARRARMLPSQRDPASRLLALDISAPPTRPRTKPPFLVRHREALRFALPAYVCFAMAVLATQIVLGHTVTSWRYYDSLIVLCSFLAILALGQGAVILTGGLDLSLPWTIALCGILFAGMVKGSDAALPYALVLVLLVGAAVGFLNGLGVVMLGVSPIVMTLAMNGILQGLALIYSNGTPAGFSSPLLRRFMTEPMLGVTPVVLFDVLFVIVAVLLLGRTPFGRRIYAVGNGARAAAFAGVGVGGVLVRVYMLSGLCSALVGVLLTGFSGQASLGMGDEYLLPSIAVVVVGGTLITGGRGHYLGMLGGVLLLTALQTLLAGTTLPYATRAILFGLVVLGAVIALRERRS
jgi:ribose transport system permease protein